MSFDESKSSVSVAYTSLCASNHARSFARAVDMSTPEAMSDCERFTTAHHPNPRCTAFPLKTSVASVPLSIRSSFVSTPSVRVELGSTSFATRTPSLVAMSALAADTATMTTFLLTMNFLAIVSMSKTVDAGWSAVATFVRPGMSTSVRLGAPAARMDSMMGSAETAFLWPFDCKDRSVSRSISKRTSLKSEKTVFGLCRNRADATSDAGAPCSCSTSGRRVHIPAPRGKKSLPTMASSTLDLPLLWPPTTTIWGRVSHSEGSFEALPEASESATSPASAHASCSLLTSRRRGSMGVGSAADDASAICASRDIAACAVK